MYKIPFNLKLKNIVLWHHNLNGVENKHERLDDDENTLDDISGDEVSEIKLHI